MSAKFKTVFFAIYVAGIFLLLKYDQNYWAVAFAIVAILFYIDTAVDFLKDKIENGLCFINEAVMDKNEKLRREEATEEYDLIRRAIGDKKLVKNAELKEVKKVIEGYIEEDKDSYVDIDSMFRQHTDKGKRVVTFFDYTSYPTPKLTFTLKDGRFIDIDCKDNIELNYGFKNPDIRL